jgi:hypothetical protein
MQEIPGFVGGVKYLKQKYDNVTLIMRLNVLTDRMKMLRRDGINFFTVSKQ